MNHPPADFPEDATAPGHDRDEEGLRLALRFTRPDGSAVFGPDGPDPERVARLALGSNGAVDPGPAFVLRSWFPGLASKIKETRGPAPLPSHRDERLALAILRADWLKRGDFLAVDHRRRDRPCRLEVFGAGRRWLGPSWEGPSPVDSGPSSTPRPPLYRSTPHAELAEWSFRAVGRRVTRTVLLLRGRNLALLADQVDGGGGGSDGSSETRIELAPGVSAAPTEGGRALALSASRGASARIYPLHLPTFPEETATAMAGGSLLVEANSIVSRRREGGARSWSPLLVSWSADRHRRPVRWRALTVAEKSRVCPPDVAFAARIAWGTESLVVYRSLTRPALRSFLGRQTKARFLVGLFNKNGDVEPLIEIDD